MRFSTHSGRPLLVIPAKAGIQTAVADTQAVFWMPAFAGMTMRAGFAFPFV